MKKFIITVLAIAVLLSVCIFSAVAASDTGSLSMTGAEGTQGDIVAVTVKLNDNPGLITMKFSVSYPSDLELLSVQNSGLLNGWTTPAPTVSSPYTIRWADALANANNTSVGKIVTLNFKIKETASIGDKTISLTFNESRDVEGGKNTFNDATATVSVKNKTGWVKDGYNWYYYTNGAKTTGWKQILGKWYYFHSNGIMVKGWLDFGYGTKYYMRSDGSMATGWVQILNKWYYFNANGEMYKGWLDFGYGTKYYMRSDGSMATGWVQILNKWYYFNANGEMYKGWLDFGYGTKYYMRNDGTMATGWLKLGSTWYYFNASGAMVTGTVTIDGKQHKFTDSGAWLGEVQNAKNGWVSEGGKWYYYKNGAKATGWVSDGGKWYYMNGQGVMQTGWLKLGNIWYYMNTSGVMVTGAHTIGGKLYHFDTSGACLNP